MKQKQKLPEAELVQQIGTITGFSDGIQLGELRDLFIRLVSTYDGVVRKDGKMYVPPDRKL